MEYWIEQALRGDRCKNGRVGHRCMRPAGGIAGSSGRPSGHVWSRAKRYIRLLSVLRTCPCAGGVGGGKFEYYGLGMLSRIPLSRTAAFQLGPGHTGSPVNAENEPRILQIALLPLEEPVVIGNTHLAATRDWSLSAVRRSQAGKTAGMLRPLAVRAPLILCGDFNAGPTSSDLAEIREALPHFYSSNERTYAEDHGRPPIDFFCSSVALEVSISVYPADELSDHRIVVATCTGIGSRI